MRSPGLLERRRIRGTARAVERGPAEGPGAIRQRRRFRRGGRKKGGTRTESRPARTTPDHEQSEAAIRAPKREQQRRTSISAVRTGFPESPAAEPTRRSSATDCARGRTKE